MSSCARVFLERAETLLGGGDEATEAHLAGNGPVAELERRLADHFGFRYALAVANATLGLMALEMALDLKGAEILTSPFPFGGSIAGALHLGSRLRFADVDEGLNLDPKAAREAITRRTRALLALDANGYPADLPALRRVADDHGLPLLVDAAQSAGALRNCAPAMQAADAAVLSFGARKTIAAGEGGAILTSDRALYERLVLLTQHPQRQRRDVSLQGFDQYALNFRCHPMAALWALAFFDESLESLARWQKLWRVLTATLAAEGLVRLPPYGVQVLPARFRPALVAAEGVSASRLAQSLARLAPELTLTPLLLLPAFDDPALMRKAGGRISHAPCPRAHALVNAVYRVCSATAK